MSLQRYIGQTLTFTALNGPAFAYDRTPFGLTKLLIHGNMLHCLIADDHCIMREAIVQIIKDEWPDAVCEQVEDGPRLVQKAAQGKWDVIITDISMPLMNGIEALEIIKKKTPDTPVLIISIHTENRYAIKALNSGAAGFIPKPLIEMELTKAIHLVLSGKKYMTEELALQLGSGL